MKKSHIHTPSIPRPPDADVRHVFPDLARLLSSAERDCNNRFAMPSDELEQELQSLRHSEAAIRWAIHLGIQLEWLLETVLVRKVQMPRGRHAVEAKATPLDVIALAATEELWHEWRTGDFARLVQTTPRPRGITLALSGGGMRATMFHLGMFIVLAEQRLLKDTRAIVAVSGGAILAAHFAKNWQRAVSDASSFRQVAAELIELARSDIRNQIIIPWLWTRLFFIWFSAPWGRTARLRRVYERHFGTTALGELDTPGCPLIALVATDAIRQERVAFTATDIVRLPLHGEGDINDIATPETIISKGVDLSLAVAASSCFPPVFPRLHLDHSDLGLTYQQFKGSLSLNDGGVLGNLGIEVLMALRSLRWETGTMTLVGDAERPQVAKPRNTLKADLEAQAAALSQGARERAKLELGASCAFVRLSDRVPDSRGLGYRAETALASFRTDLDAPSWQEIHALLIHGAMTTAEVLKGFNPVSSANLLESIKSIIVEAGGPVDLAVPTKDDLSRSGKLPKCRVLFHAAAVVVLMATIVISLCYGVRLLARRTTVAPPALPVASSNYEIPPLPTTTISHKPTSTQELPLLPEVNYQAFEFLSAEMLVDMRHWIPFGREDFGTRKSPVITTKRFIGRKLQHIDEIRIYGATEGLLIDAECISGQPFRIEYGPTTGKPRVNLMKEYHVVVDLSAVPTSSRFEVVTRMITWNGMKEDDPWHAFVGFAPIPMWKIQLVFPDGRPYKSRRFVTYPPGKEQEEPAEGKYKQLERQQKDQLYWELQEIEVGRTYEIQWTW